MSEPEFLNALARRTGCGLLCDVNNVYVTCANLGGDPAAWLDALDRAAVAEIHLAGHAVNDADGRSILIDDHGSPVADPVWELFAPVRGHNMAKAALEMACWDLAAKARESRALLARFVACGHARRARTTAGRVDATVVHGR